MLHKSALEDDNGTNLSHFAKTILDGKYAHTKASGHKETWPEVAKRVAHCVMDPYLPHLADKVERLIVKRKFLPGGRYLAAAGRRYPQINNCYLFITEEDSREGWADTMHKITSALMTGGGIGNVYSRLRREGATVGGMGGTSTGPCALAQMVNEAGRFIMQGGARRSAIWAGLHWNHADVKKFMALKNWSPEVSAMKRKNFNFPAPLDGTNISVILDNDFFTAFNNQIHPDHKWAQDIYWIAVNGMCTTGEPGLSIDIDSHIGENARNACTEVTSPDDSDMCNLSSHNLARYYDIDDFEEAVYLSIAFMLCGTLYSPLPLPKMYKVRDKNRRLGLGLMGMHEWLLRRDKRYGRDDELEKWLAVYAKSNEFAKELSSQLGISCPVATRAIAPTGTIAIVAETTSAIEPIFAVAVKRRYLNNDAVNWKYQYIMDACAERLMNAGIDPETIEDAYTLAEDYERRIEFQSWVQQYVDHGISSTINMPSWGSSVNNLNTVTSFGKTLYKYLPGLRGITVYPDGARGGQPLNRVSYSEARGHIGKEFMESGEQVSVEISEFGNEQACKNGVCGM